MAIGRLQFLNESRSALVGHWNRDLRYTAAEVGDRLPSTRPSVEVMDQDESTSFDAGVEISQACDGRSVQIRIKMDEAVP